ncbi:MAG: glycosyltransferase family 4 protein [Candidatus Nitrohelix vancouverensis]|uniref:Glycosyltransferase family 4 protein n=1 Tax=Candidatus Nitrohelix vancouverensis TaxID=2705534 RepID=A0A7T0C5A1_9BACT|nr:MAG: glycosyltransferase family 4 protein [Candidatus Nitrohelix vancouverensis]
MRGGEKCLEIFCRLFPEADLHTLLWVEGAVSPEIERHPIRTSFLQKLPFIKSHYRYYLPLMPLAIGQMDLREYDLVLSSSHCVAKGVRTSPEALHVCYCHTPMRYVWDQFDQYFGKDNSSPLVATAMRIVAPFLRRWDVRTSRGVTSYIANSEHVRKRIQKHYQRDSTVIHPPADTVFYQTHGEAREDFFLILSAFAPYKRVDLAVDAFNELGYPLVVVGAGQEADSLRQRARKNIQFKGWLSSEDVRSYLGRCRALIFPGEEDFGITPVEAQAMGTPVIAFGKGGALETVVPDPDSWKAESGIPKPSADQTTGVFFYEATRDSLMASIKHFEEIESRFDPQTIRDQALKFRTEAFAERIRVFIQDQLTHHRC